MGHHKVSCPNKGVTRHPAPAAAARAPAPVARTLARSLPRKRNHSTEFESESGVAKAKKAFNWGDEWMDEWMNEQGQNDENDVLSEWDGVGIQKWMNTMIKNGTENEQLKMKNWS